MPVSGWNQCVKWVAPRSIAHSFIAAATASASAASSSSPASSVSCSCLKTAFGRRWRWTAGEKTFSPKTSAPGWVRSAWPSVLPFGLHRAEWTLDVRVRAGMISSGTVLVAAQRRRAVRAQPYPPVQSFGRCVLPVEVERELVRVGPDLDAVGLLAPELDVGRDQVLGEDVALGQERVVGRQRVERLVERRRHRRDVRELLGRELVQ